MLLDTWLFTNLNKMEITVKRNYGFELIFEAENENVKVTEDIEERTAKMKTVRQIIEM